MTRLFVGLALPLTTLFALLLGGLHLLMPGETVRAAFGDCAMPCWYGVEPGVTERRPALARLKAAGWMLDGECNAAVYETCYQYVRGETGEVAFVYTTAELVRQIALLDFGLPLGDLWLSFGAPDYVAIPPYHNSVPMFDMALWFGGSGVSGRMGFPCPADFGDMLAFPMDTMLIWQEGTAMNGTAALTVAQLRLMLQTWCSD